MEVSGAQSVPELHEPADAEQRKESLVGSGHQTRNMLTANQTNQSSVAASRNVRGSSLSSNTRIRCSPIKSKPSTDSRTLG